MIMVKALPSSIENPGDGEWRVILLPRFRMMLYPYVHRPMTVPAPPNTLGSCEPLANRGVEMGLTESTAVLLLHRWSEVFHLQIWKMVA